jgi:hypothetical protein
LITCRDIAHYYWRSIIEEGDTVVDATCGAGNDTLELLIHLAVSPFPSLLVHSLLYSPW